ncbi:MAG: aminotransferase class IV [Marinilabiliales bacterium]|nr:MAG: aminotransferase class IV [Marinilabiliales bacterium]
MECIKDFFLHNFKFLPSSEFDEDLPGKGTSIYEVIKVEKGIPIFLEDHLNRLYNSADISNLSINESYCDFEALIGELIKKNKTVDGKIKIIIRFANSGKSEKDLLIYFTPQIIPSLEDYENGVEVGICNAIRSNPNAKIYNTIARKKANDRIAEENIFEVLLINKDGFITEGSRSNVFFIRENKVITAPSKEVLNGITRKHIVNICTTNKISLFEHKVHQSDISKMDALFLTGTSIKVLPVKNIGKNEFNPDHEVLRKIMELYDQARSNYLFSKT